MPDEGSKGALAQPEAMLLVRQMVLVRLDWLSITPLGRPGNMYKMRSVVELNYIAFRSPVVPLEKGRIPRVSSTSNNGLLAYPAPSFCRNCDNGVALVFESSVTVITCI